MNELPLWVLSCPLRLRQDECIWLHEQKYSHATILDRNQAVEFCNKEMGVPIRAGAVFRAFNSGEIPTALISGKALASPFDVAAYLLNRKRRKQSSTEGDA